MNKIVAVVVTYNRKKMLKENVESLLKQSYNKFDIMIIDNNSDDGTDKYVESIDSKRIIYINTGKNLGGAGGFNFGVKNALLKKYKYCWIMDDDTIPTDTSLEELVISSTKLKNDFSYICSLVKWIDNKPCNMNSPRLDSKWFEYANEFENKLFKVKSCTFVSVFINLEVAITTALPVKEMFIYGDDHEYTERLGKIKPGYLCFSSLVIHKMPNNSGFDIVTIPQDRIYRYFYDSRNRLYRARRASTYDVFAYFYWLITSIFRIMFKSKNKKIKRIWIIIKGFVASIFFYPKLEYINKKK